VRAVLLDALRRTKGTWGRNVTTRVIVAGSSTEYGKTADNFDGRPLPESAPLVPVSPYGVSKVATENLATQYFLAHGVQALTARFFIQIGVGGTDSLAIHQFCKQIAMAELGLAVPVIHHGNLETSRDMTNALDSAPVVIELAERGVPGEAYNIGSGRTMTMLNLLHTAMSLSRVPVRAEAQQSRFRVYDEKVLLANISKVVKLTSWVPATNMTSSVASILDYWRLKVRALYVVKSGAADDQKPSGGAAEDDGGSSKKLFRATRVRQYKGSLEFGIGRAEERGRMRHGVSATDEERHARHANGRGSKTGSMAGKSSCSNWAVFTSIFPPTEAVRAVASMPHWCVVVSGDKKGPATYNLSGVVYLTPEDQRKLGYHISAELPWNHFGRKNVGYLYAIQHGAQNIFDVDDDNIINCAGNLAIPSTPSGLGTLHEVETKSKIYNLYPQLSHTTAWPRGFPLDAVKNSTTYSATFKRGVTRNVAVLQSLADYDPDVDAIWRLTARPLPFAFDGPNRERVMQREGDIDATALTQSPTAASLRSCKKKARMKAEDGISRQDARDMRPLDAYALPRGTMMPYNAQATLHSHAALWSLLLPCSVHGRVSDIWRSYLTQRLFWGTGLTVAFSQPFVSQYRNAHAYLGDLLAEFPLYRQAGALVDALIAWQPRSSTLPGQFEELYVELYERGVLELSDVRLAQAWIGDLIRVGYTFPQTTGRVRPASKDGSSGSGCTGGFFFPCRGGKGQSRDDDS
jgi:nucleoside-diphosphate-sugar epimerase